MFKFSKKFKLFSNIKRVVSSSLIIGAIFSNVSLGAVSLQEARNFLQSASHIVIGASNLCNDVGSPTCRRRAFRVASRDFADVRFRLRQKLIYLQDLSYRLNRNGGGADIQLCSKREQFAFYEDICKDLLGIETYLFILEYKYNHPDCKYLGDLYIRTQRHIDDLRRRIEASQFNKSRSSCQSDLDS